MLGFHRAGVSECFRGLDEGAQEVVLQERIPGEVHYLQGQHGLCGSVEC